MPPEGPETEQLRSQRKMFDNEWPNAAALLSGSASIDPVSVEILDKTDDGSIKSRPLEAILDEAVIAMESK